MTEREPVGRGAPLPGRRGLVKMGAGFAVAVALVYLLGVAVGWRETLATLSGADGRFLALACVSTALGLAAWGKAWQVVLAQVGYDVAYGKLVVTYFAATFANYVTPFGQAGGEPFIAFVLSRDTEASYEEALASVMTADLLNLLPFFNFAAIGVGVLLVRGSAGGFESVAVVLGCLAVGVPAAVVLGWRYRTGLERLIVRVLSPVATRTDRIDLESVRDRIGRFYAAIEDIAAAPRRLATALGFSYVGWILFTVPLYLSARTLGIEVRFLLTLFVVPASTVAGLVPTPGGLAAVEGALVGLLLELTTIADPSAAFAVATVYRLASYWFAIALGGLAALRVLHRI